MSATAPKLRTTEYSREMLREAYSLESEEHTASIRGGRVIRLLDDIDTLLAENARLQAGSGITEEQVERARDAVSANGGKYITPMVMRAALEAASPLAPQQAPEGWVLVPVEPTEAMVNAVPTNKLAAQDYRAMLAASPAAPVDAGGAWRFQQTWSARARADGKLEPGVPISGTCLSGHPTDPRIVRHNAEHFGRIKPGEPFFYVDATFVMDFPPPPPVSDAE